MDKILAFLIAIPIIIGLALLLSFPLMWAWNYTIPSLFNLREIGLLDAFCLMFIAECLVKSSRHS